MEDLKSLRMDAPKYGGKTNFTIWQLTVKDVLIQQGLDDALEKTKPKEMSDTNRGKNPEESGEYNQADTCTRCEI